MRKYEVLVVLFDAQVLPLEPLGEIIPEPDAVS
jgi:hypothetical protein